MTQRTYTVYILASESGTLYIGVTGDMYRRLSEHKQKLVDGFTKKYDCDKLVYYETYTDVTEAITREKQLKNWRRAKKEKLISTVNILWRDLSEEWG
jgi:putative endonuclease